MHLMRAAIAAVLSFACIAAPSIARGAGPVDDLVAEVMAKNPSLRARAQRQEAAREDARAAGRWPDPRVTVMVDRVPSSSMTRPSMTLPGPAIAKWTR